MSNKNLTIGLVIAIVIAVVGLFTPAGSAVQKVFGGLVNYDEVDATAIKIGGSNGSRIGPIISGTCTLTVQLATIAASTTAPYDCAVTGVAVGDTVIANLATSTVYTVGQGAGFFVVGSKASTTAAFITVDLFNGTGAAANPSTFGYSSTTNYLVTHPVTSVPGL